MAFRFVFVRIVGVVCFLALFVATGFAGVYQFTSAPIGYDFPLSLGFQFSTNSTVTVTALGYYDDLQDGFATAHEVGIFDSQGNLLTSASLTVGSVNFLNDDFRYQTITPIVLAANQTYILAATSNGECPSCTVGRDAWVYGGPATLTGFSVDPRITIGPNAGLFVYQNDNVLRDPTDHFSDYVIYAANFEIASAVPEPSTWLIMMIGFSGIGLFAYRRTKKTSAIAD